MCSIPPLGALKKDTGEYVYPAIANKTDKYVCPDCSKDLILKKGAIRVHHFAHIKDDNPCNYYNKPSESQIHKDAKMLMKHVLETRREISFIRKCCDQRYSVDQPCIWDRADEYTITIPQTAQIITEYPFNYNGRKIADVAVVDNNEITCIIEIYKTHRTQETDRPEPWFEIDAIQFIETVNQNNEILQGTCIRSNTCDDCELIQCNRCDDVTPKFTIRRNLCFFCYLKYYRYFDIPYADKEKIKLWGGRWDSKYNRWYVNVGNKYIDSITHKWKVWEPPPA